ncbi:fluoride efflux transporter CrcB [Desulfitobacterium chlororespirans]|uniref:Fluoride-specific ion channel FluC n=1 Tax=Desulfitobacterium chlororespirans DSM 11544 TaxID=1121395 RepID=A0A1M7UQ32_9FIRM|nr:fluoride efflux transporter CrcB [Desulfitobacterium chlororespirans]SHN85006.1 camphor resistance protein CrcB [Desulfitobacterium chlororespirans DSM 11544]
MIYLWIGIAGMLGAILRYLISVLLLADSLFPFATLTINLLGSFLLAWLTSHVFKKARLSPHLSTAIGTGFIGSFTTFSALSVETLRLFQDGNNFLGMVYVVMSLFGGLAMSHLGLNVSKEVQES